MKKQQKKQCGLNTKNIKLNPAKHCDLVIQVLEYREYKLLSSNRKNEYIQKSLNKFIKQIEKKDGEVEEEEEEEKEYNNRTNQEHRNSNI